MRSAFRLKALMEGRAGGFFASRFFIVNCKLESQLQRELDDPGGLAELQN